MGSAGTQTSGLVFGGRTPPATFTNTESWDGSAWTEVADLATSRSTGAGDGASSTNALFSGGVVLPNTLQTATEEWTFSGLDPSTTPAADYANAITGDFYYNSSSGQFKTVNAGVGAWAAGGNLDTPASNTAGAGTQTAAINFGGRNPPNTALTRSAQYDGTSWTTTPNLSLIHI